MKIELLCLNCYDWNEHTQRDTQRHTATHAHAHTENVPIGIDKIDQRRWNKFLFTEWNRIDSIRFVRSEGELSKRVTEIEKHSDSD